MEFHTAANEIISSSPQTETDKQSGLYKVAF